MAERIWKNMETHVSKKMFMFAGAASCAHVSSYHMTSNCIT